MLNHPVEVNAIMQFLPLCLARKGVFYGRNTFTTKEEREVNSVGTVRTKETDRC